MKFVIPEWLNISLEGIQNQRILLFIALIITIIMLSYIINMILLNSVGGIYRVFIAPGVIVHEMSHAFACLITGAKVTSIQVFKKNGGEVRHNMPKIPIIGQILISLAPFIVGFLAIYFLAKTVGFKPLPVDSISDPNNIIAIIKDMIISIDYRSLISWLAFYLIITIAVTMIPSTQDFRNILLSIIALIIIIYILIKYLGVKIDLNIFLRPELMAILTTTIFVLITMLFLSIIMAVVSNLIKFK